jgi:ABC-type transporter Mla MlaB component
MISKEAFIQVLDNAIAEKKEELVQVIDLNVELADFEVKMIDAAAGAVLLSLVTKIKETVEAATSDQDAIARAVEMVMLLKGKVYEDYGIDQSNVDFSELSQMASIILFVCDIVLSLIPAQLRA